VRQNNDSDLNSSTESEETVGGSTPSRARRPLRKRGVERYNVLLDAAEVLLNEADPADVGLYQIAEQAGVPAASVYHFFPTKSAAFLALAERYIEVVFPRLLQEPIPAARLRSWQDLWEIEQERALQSYRENRWAMKLFLASAQIGEISRAELRFSEEASDQMFSQYDSVFHMPYVKDSAAKFEIMITVTDAIWGASYSRFGEITDLYAAEALAAGIAYGRTFLPDRMEPRDHVRLAAARGDTILVA
jgi:AcrR family transcriptional regulator